MGSTAGICAVAIIMRDDGHVFNFVITPKNSITTELFWMFQFYLGFFIGTKLWHFLFNWTQDRTFNLLAFTVVDDDDKSNITSNVL